MVGVGDNVAAADIVGVAVGLEVGDDFGEVAGFWALWV